MSVVRLDMIDESTTVGLWCVEEPLSFFEQSLSVSPEEGKEIAALPERRRLEWYACRYILALADGSIPRKCTSKTDAGKPFLFGSYRMISLSHTEGLAAAVVSNRACGIDVQRIVPKITRIAHKFVGDEEAAFCPDDDTLSILFYHIIWSAKEAIYKAYGAGGLDFRQHIHIQPFVTSFSELSLEGWVIKNQEKRKFDLFCSLNQQYVLVYGLEE